jgi:hypothetical protein
MLKLQAGIYYLMKEMILPFSGGARVGSELQWRESWQEKHLESFFRCLTEYW